MNLFYRMLVGGKKEFERTKQISDKLSVYGSGGVSIDGRGGVQVKYTDELSDKEKEQMRSLIASSSNK